MDATGTEIVRVQARARRTLVKDHQLFALFKAPERRGQRANIHRLRGDIQQVIEDTADLTIEHAHILAALRDRNAGEPLHRQTKGMLLVHRRDIIQPVEITDALQIGLVLQQLLGAAVQQADMRINAFDHLAIQLQHHAQHAVRGRVHRAEIDREIADVFGGGRIGHSGAPPCKSG